MSLYKLETEDYLSSNFRPENIAHQLVRETTTAQDTSVDVTPALKRLTYDIQEIEEKMKAVCEKNADVLLENTESMHALAQKIGVLQPSLENMNETYQKLERDFLTPYKTATALQVTGENLSYTAQLCRSLSWYLQLALEAQSQEYTRESVVNNGVAGRAILRTATALKAIEKLSQDVPDLQKINAVSNFAARINGLRDGVIESASRLIKNFDGFNTVQMKSAALSLGVLDFDVTQVIETHIKTLVGTTVLQLSRNSGTARDHERAFSDAQKRNNVVSCLITVTNEIRPSSSIASNNFWEQVSSQLDQKLKTLSVANPNAFKLMVANQEAILTCTQAVTSVHNVYRKYLIK